MNTKRVIGVGFLIISAFVLIFANYQQGRIDEGSAKANAKIKKGSELFQGNPATEAVGGALGKAAKKKVATEVAKYEAMVMWLKTGGIIIGILGLGILVLSGNRRKK